MLLVGLSFGIGMLVSLFFAWLFGGEGLRFVYGIVPGIIATVAVFFLGMRRVQRELQALSARVQETLAAGAGNRHAQNQELAKKKMREAIRILEGGLRLGPWAPFVGSQLRGQIGQLYYLMQENKRAVPFLQAAFFRDWVAQGMRGAILFKEKNYDEMKRVFEKAVKSNKKESLLWNLYAWCLLESGDRSAAIEVLARAKRTLPTEERTQRNLEALQKNKGMKMNGWEMMWYQFQLETPQVQPMMKQRIDRRALYRGR